RGSRHTGLLRPRAALTVPPLVRLERNVIPEVVLGEIFGGREKFVVVIAEQIVALVPGDLANHTHQRDVEIRVALVAALFLPLPEIPGVDVIDGLVERAIS